MAQKSPAPKPAPGPQQPSKLASIGGTLVALGTLLIVGSAITQERGWMLYGGIGMAVLGAILWTMGGVEWRQAAEWLKSGAFALAIALTIRWGFAEPYRIPSQSMYPTLNGDPGLGKGDRVFVNKWIYGVRVPFMDARLWHGKAPERWDIVVFNSPEENAQYPTLVKRIVGMPGERIHIPGDGKVYADGKPLVLPDSMPPDTHYTAPMVSEFRYGLLEADEYSVVPEGHYLVLGDNSSNSRDGRAMGWLPNENIVGRVASIWWPPSSWRDFTGFSKTLWWRAGVLFLGLYVLARLFLGRSWPLYRRADGGKEHVLVSFVSLGLRLPFTTRWLTRWGKPERGDLVLYHMTNEANPEGILVAGRIAGLAGERVSLPDGKLHINQAPVAGVPLLAGPAFRTDLPGMANGKKSAAVPVPEGSYYVLADGPESEETLDSRTLGCVPEKHVLGKAVAVWWPWARRRRDV